MSCNEWELFHAFINALGGFCIQLLGGRHGKCLKRKQLISSSSQNCWSSLRRQCFDNTEISKAYECLCVHVTDTNVLTFDSLPICTLLLMIQHHCLEGRSGEASEKCHWGGAWLGREWEEGNSAVCSLYSHHPPLPFLTLKQGKVKDMILKEILAIKRNKVLSKLLV